MIPDHKGSGEPAHPSDPQKPGSGADQAPPNEGVSTPQPAEGADDFPPPNEGSPQG